MPRAIFLDRDNTIIANDGYLGDPAKVKLMAGAAAALASLRSLGYLIVVVSNQSGVGRGFFTEAAVDAVNAQMQRQLQEQAGATVDANYYCPYHPQAKLPKYRKDHEWRKPRPGMLQAAANDLSLDLSQCWMIGDQPGDVAAGASVGCRTILLDDPDHPRPDSPETPNVTPHYVVRTLADAARIIVREKNTPPRDAADVAVAPAVQASSPAEPTATPPPLAPEAPNPAVSSSPAAPAFIESPISNGQLPPESVPTSEPPPQVSIQPKTVIQELELRERTSASTTTEPVTWPSPPETTGQEPRVGGPPPPEITHPVLEEMLLHLRQLNRHHHLPEFSLAMLLAAMGQMIVLVFMAIAAWDAMAAQKISPVLNPRNWWYLSTSQRLDAIAWLIAALVIQVLVVALHLYHRNK